MKPFLCNLLFATLTLTPASTVNCSEPLQVQVSGTTPPCVTHLWNFGDGAGPKITGATATHFYSVPGTYTITHIAKTRCQSDTASQTVNVADFCCIGYDDALVPDTIFTDTTWSTLLRLNKTIFIMHPSILTIASGTTIEFGPLGKIVVMPYDFKTATVQGGHLILLPNSILTSVTNSFPNCPVMWQGVEVWGAQDGNHSPNEKVFHGKVTMTTATIENAHIGILAGKSTNKFGLFEAGGGIVDVSASSKFNKCGIGVMFFPFTVFIVQPRNISRITSGTQFNGGVLLDPGYKKGNPNTHPAFYAPQNATGRSGFGVIEFGTNGITIDGGSPSTKNTFDNIEKAIVSIDAKQNIANCSFNKHVYGIYIQNTTTSLAKQHSISANTFKDSVTTGIFINSGRTDRIERGNVFNPDQNPNQSVNKIGVLLQSSSGFQVLDNQFNFHTEGIEVENSGVGGGFIGTYTTQDGNLFTGCKIGVVADGNNSKLTIRCNKHDDAPAVAFSTNWEKTGTLANQGTLPPSAKNAPCQPGEDKLPAGNEFVTLTRKQITNAFGASFNYVRHKAPPSVIPVTVGAISVQASPCVKNPLTSCIDGCSGSSCVPCCRLVQVSTLTTDVAALQAEFNAVLANLDQGQTTALLAAIAGNTSNGNLKNLLLEHFPLSDTVLLAFMARNNVPNGHLKDVFVANSPVSDAVLFPLQEKLTTITSDGTAKHILEAQGTSEARTLTAIEREMNSKDALRQVNLNAAVSEYVSTDSLEKAEALLIAENKNYARQMLFANFLENGDLTNASATLSAFVPLNSDEAGWKTLSQLLLTLAQQGKTLFAIDAAQLQTVRNFANEPASSQARANARAILYLLFYEEFPLEDAAGGFRVMNENEGGEPPSPSGRAGEGLKISPNPFSNFTALHYTLPENTKSVFIHIFDVRGIKIKSYPLNIRANTVMVSSEGMHNGIYSCILEADGVILETKKLVVLKNTTNNE